MGKVVRYHRPGWNNYRQKSQRRRRPAKRSRWSKLIGAAILAGMIGVPVAAEIGPPLVGCKVKGNISFKTGERIYHVPGQEYYSPTRINLFKGERWFCSEEAARAAGWRKARR